MEPYFETRNTARIRSQRRQDKSSGNARSGTYPWRFRATRTDIATRLIHFVSVAALALCAALLVWSSDSFRRGSCFADSQSQTDGSESSPGTLKDLNAEGDMLLRRHVEQLKVLGEARERARGPLVARYADAASKLLQVKLKNDEMLRKRKQHGNVESERFVYVRIPASATSWRLRLASARATNKEAVGILVSGGRLAFLMEYGDGAIPRDMNRADIEGELPQPGIRLKPGRGRRIKDAPDFKQEFRREIGRFKSDKHFFQIAVWPDSYKEFAIIRELLLDEHFGYCPLLPKKGDAVQGGGVSVEM